MPEVQGAVPATGAVAQEPLALESVNKLSQIPVVESTIGLATDVYKRVKDSHSVVTYALDTAESAAAGALHAAQSAAQPMEKHAKPYIQRVDSALSSGIDYVESKVPAVKMQPKQMVDCVYGQVVSAVQPVVDRVQPMVAPVMEAVCSVCGTVTQTAKQLYGKATGNSASTQTERVQCAQCLAQEQKKKANGPSAPAPGTPQNSS